MIFIRPNPELYASCNQSRFADDRATFAKNFAKNQEHHSKNKNTLVLEKTPLHREENDVKTTIAFDVAGFTMSQINVELEDHVLTVSAERTNKLGDTFKVRRRFALEADTYDEESIHANLEEDGVLELIVTKRPTPKPRQIKITTASSRTEPSSDIQNKEEQTWSDATSEETASEEEDPWDEIVRSCLAPGLAEHLISYRNGVTTPYDEEKNM